MFLLILSHHQREKYKGIYVCVCNITVTLESTTYAVFVFKYLVAIDVVFVIVFC